MKLAKFIFTLLTFCFLTITATSCTFNPFTNRNHLTGNIYGPVIGAATGAATMGLLGAPKPIPLLAGLGGGAIGYYVTTLRYEAGGIIQAGGEVYTEGDYLGIYVPTDKLFEANSAEILPQAPPILASMATILQRYPCNNILVSSSTSGFGASRWELRLSRLRAQRIADYLRSTGVNNFQGNTISIRRLNYVGYGDYFPIASNYTNKRIRENSRIQITAYPSRQQLGISNRNQAMANAGAFN
jgi:hypothetical protein